MKSLYDNDKELEELFGKWLDDNFYEELVKRDLILGWYRVNGEKLQKDGEDTIIITNKREEIIIDEKATLHYINANLPTFACELKNQQSGAKGWIINNNLKTEYYLLAWPNGSDVPKTANDFYHSDVMLISKKDVLDIIRDSGIDINNIDDFIDSHIKKLNKDNNKVNIAYGVDLNVNFNLAERPINLVIRREVLEKKALIYNAFGDVKCDRCGAMMTLRSGNKGLFYGCTNYPNCINTKKYEPLDLSIFEGKFK